MTPALKKKILDAAHSLTFYEAHILLETYEQLKAENTALRKALEYYADENEWIDYKAECSHNGVTERVHSHFDDDFGAQARAALDINEMNET